MKIRRFFASDMRKALKQVSDELGPDAAIMSTRKTKDGVEIVAATDYEQALDQHKAKLDETKRSVSVKVEGIGNKNRAAVSNKSDMQNSKPRTRPNYDIEWHQEPELLAIKQEVGLMRELLQDQLGELTWHEKNRKSPIQAAILRKMIKMGFTPKIASEFSKTVTSNEGFEQGWKELRNNICSALPTVENNILQKGGIVSLIGPTGVGKTTSIAKLAARFVLKHGPESIALVTTDSYRVAAHEQLRIYANIMGISMRVSDSSESLNVILDELAEKKLILIDTAGISQRDKKLAEQMACLMNSSKSIDSYLVLSSTAQTLVLKESIKTFSAIPLAGVILTKLDESISLGESLGTIIEAKLKLAYVTNGQRVPEDLHKACPEELFDKAETLENSDAEDWVTAMRLNQG